MAAALLLLMLSLLLGGCLRTQASFTVNEDDRVSGHVIAAQVPRNAEDKGPQLRVPDALFSKVRVQAYEADGYIGTEMYFNNLSFAETRQLAQAASEVPGAYELALSRVGGKVTLTGRMDLRNLPSDRAETKITFSFPSSVGATNGNRETSHSVSWSPAPGEVTLMRAEVDYTDPNTRSFAGWTGLVVGVGIGIAIVVAAMAWVNRDQSPKPGQLMAGRPPARKP